MGAISAMGTTFNLPNYTGELFHVTPQDTPFLSAISGLSAENLDSTVAGADVVNLTQFTWQTVDLRDAADDRQALEGADISAYTGRTRSVVRNVLEIHHEALSLSYSQQSAYNNRMTNSSSYPPGIAPAGPNPVTNEASFQIGLQLAQVARDVEKTFLTGTLNEPATNAAARKTQGLIGAITTNVIAAGLKDLAGTAGNQLLLDLMQMVWEAGGISDEDTAALICNGYTKRRLTKRFIEDGGYQQDSRTIGGVRVDTIATDFGNLNVILDRHCPAGTLVVASLEQCQPVVLDVENKGPGFFVEPLAKTGANDRWQIYGEIGLKYGNEKAHGKITGLPTAAWMAS